MGMFMKPWYERTYIWGQVNLTENDPETCDIDFYKAYWKEAGTEGVIINCGGIVSYYQSRFPGQYKAASLGDKDYFGIWNEAARQAGLSVIARMDINSTTQEMFQLHPDWYCRDKENQPIMTQGRYVTCVNGDYYQEFIPLVLTEIIEKYHPDGFADNSWAGLGRDAICYCRRCREKFKAYSGLSLPEKADWEDSAYRKWVRWNYQIRVENWRYFNQVTKEKGGESCLWFGMLNADPFRTGGRFYDIKALIADQPFIFCDHQVRDTEGGFEQNAMNGALLKLSSSENNIVAESMAHYYKGKLTFRLMSAERAEVRKWMLSGISGGISPWFHFVGGNTRDKRKFNLSADICRYHKEERDYLTNRKYLADIGVVWNQESSIYYGREEAVNKSALPWIGMTRALSAAGIPFLPIHADDIEKYGDRLKVLILPNVAILTEEQEKSIFTWISQGKHLMITGESGCYDEEGNWKESSPILKAAGITLCNEKEGDFEEKEGDWLVHDRHTYLNLCDEKHPVFEKLSGTDLLAFGGCMEKTVSEGKLQMLASFIPAFPIYPPEFSWIREESKEAAIYAGTLDTGSRVVYLAADIDRCYGRNRIPDHQRLLEGCVRWAAGEELFLQVKAPAHVNVNVYRQKDCYAVHLLNLAGCEAAPGTLTEELPIGPVVLQIKNCAPVVSAEGRISGQQFTVKRGKEGCSVIIPVLKEQELVVIR